MAEAAEPEDLKAAVIDRSAEKETLKLLFHELVNSIDAVALPTAALSASLISEQQRSDCTSEANPYKKAEKFVGHLQRAVNGDTAKFHTFLKVLRETNQESIASRLQKEFESVFTEFQKVTNPEDDPVFVPDELVKELARLRVTFARFLYNYKKEVQNSSKAHQEEFIETLQILVDKKCPDGSLQTCFSMLIEEEVSIFNITYLDELCNVFPDDICAKTKKLVGEYEQQCQHFMASATVNQFRKLFPASVTPSILLMHGKCTITLKIQSYWGDKTVDELVKLADMLGVSVRHLHLYQIKKGCIAVAWLYPEKIVANTLQNTAGAIVMEYSMTV